VSDALVGSVRVRRSEADQVWSVRIGGSRGNVLDAGVIGSLGRIFEEAGRSGDLKAICLSGEGENFSFGASVPEHLPGQVEAMLPVFHTMFRALFDCGVFVHAAVRGRCLGGGLELVAAGHRITASPDAVFGQPEIALGVFAPVASLLLPERIGRPRAEELCLTGRMVDANEALALGLVDELAEDPEEAAQAFIRKHLLPRSAASLRFANRALRLGLRRRLDDDLAELESHYLKELMSTRDATEGLRAFLEKRAPAWRNS
jgi:cyclohexa-1,5-dienecarbonyl-CoA hydratase